MEIKTEYTKGVLKRVLSLNVETMNICNRAVTEPTKIHHCSVSLSRVRMFIRSMPDVTSMPDIYTWKPVTRQAYCLTSIVCTLLSTSKRQFMKNQMFSVEIVISQWRFPGYTNFSFFILFNHVKQLILRDLQGIHWKKNTHCWVHNDQNEYHKIGVNIKELTLDSIEC